MRIAGDTIIVGIIRNWASYLLGLGGEKSGFRSIID
jgi:hypothetical protein